jgi:DNA-binding MarR family transcriptional regulator
MNQSTERDLISQVSEQFTRAFWRMRRGAARELAPFGLTFAQARVLRVLGREEGALRIGDLAARLEIVARSATSMVDLLEEAGLAQRRPDPSDRRSVLVSPTEAGRALLVRMHEARRASAEAMFGRLDETGLATLLDMLATLNTPEPADGSQAS